jgi:hypothetical protein
MYDSALHVVIRVPDDVDELLRYSIVYQIAALRIIIEQSLKWNTSLFLNFVDFEKVFDSLGREVLWNLMAHYGIPQKFINIIRNSYNNMQCSAAIWSVKDRSFLTPACSLSFSSTAFNSLVRSILFSTYAITDNSAIPL